VSAGTAVAEPNTERSIAFDLARRGLLVAPVLIVAFALLAGADGAVSAGLAVALVCANFLLAAGLITVTARISLGAMMGAILFGYLLRLILIAVTIVLIRDDAWFHRSAFGVTLIITHLGLLFWETRYVSASLAFPGLKPASPRTRT